MTHEPESVSRTDWPGVAAEAWRNPLSRDGLVAAALLSDGDSRVAIDPHSGTNKYACPPIPAPHLVCFSSCTASPISHRGFEKAADCLAAIAGAASPGKRAERLIEYRQVIERRLLGYFGVAGIAEAILCPSGTDALLTAVTLLAGERPRETMTAILPNAAETGTGVPLAAAGRRFDGPGAGTPLVDCAIQALEIPLRSADGSPRSEDAVNGSFVAAARMAHGRPVIFLTHGSKTGLIAPTEAPAGNDVIVDACQARIDPACVAAYLRRGWPVAVTGSKFFGGPAFSGALLLPRARLAVTVGRRGDTDWEPRRTGVDCLGMILRWTAAIDMIEAFEPVAATVPGVIRDRAAAIDRALRSMPAVVPVAGLRPRGAGWADLPSIFTFAVRESANPRRLLAATELRLLYQQLAREGVLLGQPVDLGAFGALRIALGARDLMEEGAVAGLDRVFEAVARLTAGSPARRPVMAHHSLRQANADRFRSRASSAQG